MGVDPLDHRGVKPGAGPEDEIAVVDAAEEPPGSTLSGVSEPASPFAASFTVPSPPKATTTS
jgi:hypothetical protein